MASVEEQQLKLIADLEIEMMSDMYNRMTNACHKKCVPAHYRDSELSKGEAVCIDRCVAKYLDIHDRIGKKLTTMTQADEAAMKQMQGQAAPPGK